MRGAFRLLAGAVAGITVAGAVACTSRVAPTAAATTTPAVAPTTARAAGPCGTTKTAPTYRHVIWIWFENHSYSDIAGSSSAPYFNSIASECGVATNYHNHYSLLATTEQLLGLPALGQAVAAATMTAAFNL